MHSLDEHRHNKKNNLHGLTSIVQAKVIEFEDFGMKPAQMLVNLRKYADIQLSNSINYLTFLSSIETKAPISMPTVLKYVCKISSIFTKKTNQCLKGLH